MKLKRMKDIEEKFDAVQMSLKTGKSKQQKGKVRGSQGSDLTLAP